MEGERRVVSYLRLSVTDRCNLRCCYCMPPQGIQRLPHEEILTFEEIVAVVQAAVSLGISKFRLTGGEPLVRRGVIGLIRMIRAVAGVQEMAMTTNATLLADRAQALAAAGLDRINASLDSLDPTRYAALTYGGDLTTALAGIAAAERAGLLPIKINCVVEKSSAEPDAQAVAHYAAEHGYQIRFIPRMDLARGTFGVIETGGGGDCPRCNRLRVTSNGWVRPCLFADVAFSVRKLGPLQALRSAIVSKPGSGSSTLQPMVRIGG